MQFSQSARPLQWDLRLYRVPLGLLKKLCSNLLSSCVQGVSISTVALEQSSVRPGNTFFSWTKDMRPPWQRKHLLKDRTFPALLQVLVGILSPNKVYISLQQFGHVYIFVAPVFLASLLSYRMRRKSKEFRADCPWYSPSHVYTRQRWAPQSIRQYINAPR